MLSVVPRAGGGYSIRVIPDAELPAARLALVFLAALAGGGVNSIAGGGTLLTFPALVALGVPPIMANATNTMALWPGSLSAMWGYRRTLAGTQRWAVGLAVPSVLGGVAGALLLLRTTPGRFDVIVPWLVFLATVLFVSQRPLLHLLRGRSAAPAAADAAIVPPGPRATILVYQFAVAVYGGYFGAGIGILMLAALGFMGFTHIHRMNGLKNWFAVLINVVAAATLAPSGLIHWPVAATVAVGAIVGGYAGAHLAQRVAQERVRQAIVAIGFASWLWLLLR